MEITLELVERLKEKADVSYKQAKQALEYSGGNLLDALIYLEETGAIPRQEGAYFSTKSDASPHAPAKEAALAPLSAQQDGEKPPKAPKPPRPKRGGLKRFFITLRRWLVDNELEVWRHDQPITALPVLILVLLLCCASYIVIPVLVLLLFLGFRYRFSGPDLDRDEINSVIGSVADTASDLGHKAMEELRHDRRSDGE